MNNSGWVVDFKWLPNNRVIVLMWGGDSEYIAHIMSCKAGTSDYRVLEDVDMSTAVEHFPGISDLLAPVGTTGEVELF